MQRMHAVIHSEIHLLAASSLIAGFLFDEESQILVGFIQVSGLKFYRDLCPDDKKDEWFAKFSAKGDYRVST